MVRGAAGLLAALPRHGALEFRWANIKTGATHYYRLNALSSGTWVELGRGSFEAINCGVVEGMECRIGDPDDVLSVQFGVASAYSPADRPAIQQWFDLTLLTSATNPSLDGGFLPGTFLGAGPFPPGGAHFTWSGIRPSLRHFYRQNTLYGDGWEQQYSGSFVSLDCRDLPEFDPPG